MCMWNTSLLTDIYMEYIQHFLLWACGTQRPIHLGMWIAAAYSLSVKLILL